MGDYIRTLAQECSVVGVSCAVLALNDHHLQEKHLLDQTGTVSSLRLSSHLSTEERTALATSFVQQFGPDWVSLQFVAFAFHPRGFVFGLPHLLKSILPANAKLHIMMHELWVGLAINHPVREKVVGPMQRYAIKRLLQKLTPQVIQVGNKVYYSRLKRWGYEVEYLPIPSNIPIVTDPSDGWIWKELSLNREERANVYVLVLFGTLHDRWEVENVMGTLKNNLKKKLIVVSVGSQGYGKAVWDRIQKLENSNFRSIKLGFRADREISELLQFADLGICTTPYSLLGKSGSAMAMIEHGLPVVVTRDELVFPFPLEEMEDRYGQVKMWDLFREEDLARKSRPLIERKSRITDRFLSILSSFPKTTGKELPSSN